MEYTMTKYYGENSHYTLNWKWIKNFDGYACKPIWLRLCDLQFFYFCIEFFKCDTMRKTVPRVRNQKLTKLTKMWVEQFSWKIDVRFWFLGLCSILLFQKEVLKPHIWSYENCKWKKIFCIQNEKKPYLKVRFHHFYILPVHWNKEGCKWKSVFWEKDCEDFQ